MDFTTITLEAFKSFISYSWKLWIRNYFINSCNKACNVAFRCFSAAFNEMMQTLQPKMKAIQDRYKNDPQQCSVK